MSKKIGGKRVVNDDGDLQTIRHYIELSAAKDPNWNRDCRGELFAAVESLGERLVRMQADLEHKQEALERQIAINDGFARLFETSKQWTEALENKLARQDGRINALEANLTREAAIREAEDDRLQEQLDQPDWRQRT